jgi:hypothetical protein
MEPKENHGATLGEEHTVIKKNVNIWMISSFILFIIFITSGAYLVGKHQSPALPSQVVPTVASTSMVTHVPQSPTMVIGPTAAVNLNNATMGSVSGILCYPASLIPAGTIYAKSVTTGKEFMQSYPGTQNGGGTSYGIQLIPDTYHMKFIPQQYTNIVGYYTDYSTCVGNPTDPNCSGQKTRTILPVKVSTGLVVTKINLCDYYYPPDNPPQY